MVRINASKETHPYQELCIIDAIESLSLGNPAQQKPHRHDKKKLSKDSEIFPDPGAQGPYVCVPLRRKVYAE